MAGLVAARAQGRRGGRPVVMDADKLAVARARHAKGESPARIAKALGIFPGHRLQAPGRVAPREPWATLPLAVASGESRAIAPSRCPGGRAGRCASHLERNPVWAGLVRLHRALPG